MPLILDAILTICGGLTWNLDEAQLQYVAFSALNSSIAWSPLKTIRGKNNWWIDMKICWGWTLSISKDSAYTVCLPHKYIIKWWYIILSPIFTKLNIFYFRHFKVLKKRQFSSYWDELQTSHNLRHWLICVKIFKLLAKFLLTKLTCTKYSISNGTDRRMDG